MQACNRCRYRKHPDIGKRSSILNPPEAWLCQPANELRILDLLSGLMKCGLCFSAMTLKGGKYNCSGRYDRGTCANGKIISGKTVEGRALTGIKTHLLSPEAIAEG